MVAMTGYVTVGSCPPFPISHIPSDTHICSFYDLNPISLYSCPLPTQVKRVKGLVVASRAEKASMNASLAQAKREAEGLQVALSEYKGEMEGEEPEEFLCPITQMIMRDPVTTICGHTFERESIVTWFRAHATCPYDNVRVESKLNEGTTFTVTLPI